MERERLAEMRTKAYGEAPSALWRDFYAMVADLERAWAWRDVMAEAAALGDPGLLTKGKIAAMLEQALTGPPAAPGGAEENEPELCNTCDGRGWYPLQIADDGTAEQHECEPCGGTGHRRPPEMQGDAVAGVRPISGEPPEREVGSARGAEDDRQDNWGMMLD